MLDVSSADAASLVGSTLSVLRANTSVCGCGDVELLCCGAPLTMNFGFSEFNRKTASAMSGVPIEPDNVRLAMAVGRGLPPGTGSWLRGGLLSLVPIGVLNATFS